MMNPSFRAAFWALCLSLTLPLALFVAVELTAGGVTANTAAQPRNAPRAPATPPRWDPPSDAAKPSAVRVSSRATRAPQGATLSQELEPDDAEDVPLSPSRPVSIREPRDSFPTLSVSAARQVDARLTRLQQDVVQMAQVQQQQQINQLQTQLLQQLQQGQQIQDLDRRLKDLLSGGNGGGDPNDPSASPAAGTGASGNANPGSASDGSDGDRLPKRTEKPKTPSRPTGPPVVKIAPTDDGTERFSLQIKDAEITEVLEMLGQLSGQNVLASKDVAGKVTANLHDVDLDKALAAILKAGDYVYEKEGEFIYVSTPQETETRNRQNRKLQTKVYRPHYISAKDLRALITPILTAGIGKISVTAPAEIGIPTGGEQAGGDTLVERDALLIQDYSEVLEEVDRVLVEMDVPPLQVVIEAHILSVKLNDSLQFGVNFALLLGGGDNQLVTSGNGQTVANTAGSPGTSGAQIVPMAGQFLADTAGLKYGIIRGDISAFINALENVSDTSLLARPKLLALNKQRAELIIGERLSYKTLAFNGTQTVENVNFLDAGTKLRMRPFIAPDGLVRMEIHPERSTATINAQTQLPNLATTEVTSNVMVRDGETVVIGGLIEEQVTEQVQRVPFLGALPVIGAAFRNRNESIVRSELIVLLTPRIVKEGYASAEGAAAAFEEERRAEFFRNNLSPVNRRNLARLHLEQAAYHFDMGNLLRAQHHIQDSLQHNKNDVRALELKDQIDEAIAARTRFTRPPPATPADAPLAVFPGDDPVSFDVIPSDRISPLKPGTLLAPEPWSAGLPRESSVPDVAPDSGANSSVDGPAVELLPDTSGPGPGLGPILPVAPPTGLGEPAPVPVPRSGAAPALPPAPRAAPALPPSSVGPRAEATGSANNALRRRGSAPTLRPLAASVRKPIPVARVASEPRPQTRGVLAASRSGD